ncbi:serine/threonine-protein kinase [Microbispora rosea]|uniref:serine/threonine-protein kinase n=1 Tax=Microbispora rosea TaxID=58117 RepID=UPI001E40B36B|nr:serine/threonine-protein kinase [Microbispora rosea]
MRAPSGYLLAARYRLIEPVGRGGMGTVWRARDELLDREVAVKEVRLPLVLDEDLRAELCARTEREGRATAMVAHPSVITLFDVITEDDRPWIVMELLRARSLEELIRQEGPLPPRRVADIGRQVLGALRAVHAKGILHRDVKPSNVLVTDDDRAVLTDFGLAALEGDASITQAGIVLGSAGYIAPERVLGDKASPAADLWSLGATLYTAVEGRGLHGRRTAAAALAALTSGAPIPMDKAGPLAPVLRGLLQIDPAARLDGVRAAHALSRVAAGGVADDPFASPFRTGRPTPPPIAPQPTAPETRKPSQRSQRGQHRAESRPTPKVTPRDRDSGPHRQQGPYGQPHRPGEPVQPNAYDPYASGRYDLYGSRGQSGPYGQSGQYGQFGQSGQLRHGGSYSGSRSGPYGDSYSGSHSGPYSGSHSGAFSGPHQQSGQSGQSGRRRGYPREFGYSREAPAVPSQRRRPSEGLHRKPSEPALHQVVRIPMMRHVAKMIKLLLPRRYWPRIFIK